MNNNKLLLKFKKLVVFAAEEEGVEECFLNEKQFMKHAKKHITPNEMKKLGGFRALLKTYFPMDAKVDVVYGNRMIQRHANKLSKQYGEEAFSIKAVEHVIKKALKETEVSIYKATTPIPKKPSERTLVACVSDTHFGANISEGEVGGINTFNWTIAARRLGFLADQIVTYKPQYRKQTELVIQLNGDIIAGQIHNQEWFVDLLATQFSGSLSLLSQFISYCAAHFPKVRVICTTGNHGRNVGKADKGRATTHKWDSYETMLYVALKHALTTHCKNIEFLIPECSYATYKVQGHNMLQTHGDTTINVGNPGTSINMQGIANQINKFNASRNGDTARVICVGHTHTPTAQLLENGVHLIINGCLSGVDPYAQSIGIFGNHPTQFIFEATPKFPVGDMRMIQVKAADADKKYDSIIKPFNDKF